MGNQFDQDLKIHLKKMGNGRNIITEHLSAFCGGAFGIGAVFFKPIFLDATRAASMGLWEIVGFYAGKALIFSLTTVMGGLLTAWGTDLYKNYKEYRKGKKKEPFSKNGQDSKKDKAA